MAKYSSDEDESPAVVPYADAGPAFAKRAGISEGEILMLQVFSVMAPIIFVWNLPRLVRWRFANGCGANWPSCCETGVSISWMIATPQATGAMACTFFYPMLYLWFEEHLVEKCPRAFRSLVAFQILFGVFLLTPTTVYEDVHFYCRDAMALAAIVHYTIMLKFTRKHKLRCSEVLLALTSICFALMIMLPKIINMQRYPLLYWKIESFALSGAAFFPFLWHRKL